MLDRITKFLPIEGWHLVLIIMLTQFIAAYLVNLLSYRNLIALYPIFRAKAWEDGGNIYQRLFHVKGWKEYIPSIGSFDKKNIEKTKITPDFISQYLLESLRAELCHLYAFVFSLLLLLCTAARAWFFIIAYTILLNMPCIVIQRYNRPRFERFMRERDASGNIVFAEFWRNPNGDSMSRREIRDEQVRMLRDKKKAERIMRKQNKAKNPRRK